MMLDQANEKAEQNEHHGKTSHVNDEVDNAVPMKHGFVSKLLKPLVVAMKLFPMVHSSLLLPLSKHKAALMPRGIWNRHANSVNFALKGLAWQSN